MTRKNIRSSEISKIKHKNNDRKGFRIPKGSKGATSKGKSIALRKVMVKGARAPSTFPTSQEKEQKKGGMD